MLCLSLEPVIEMSLSQAFHGVSLTVFSDFVDLINEMEINWQLVNTCINDIHI